ncbi:MAG: DedA family protein [Buchnera aphidicola (Periphyllus acericola)]|uniref:DedA family protein n=1 Tax=Buchnera aphidicola TaxID=9 RepID=UPI0030CECF2E|nr:DedA family protein [Buchnera aphidicola (Periphyllus acericola)]
MELLFNYISSQPLIYFCLIIAFVSFIESLAIIGLFIPGMMIMSTFGAIIANSHEKFYPSWIASTIGCLLGDWISYLIGFKFKKWINKLKIFKKYNIIIEKIIKTLNKYSVLTIFFGKFIGPTRPIIPILAGMLDIPFIKKFFFPNLFSCIIWPILYLIPGILTVLLINVPDNNENNYFKKFFIFNIIIILISIWIIFKIIKNTKDDKITSFLIKKKFSWIPKIILVIGIINIIILQFNEKMIILRSSIIKIFYF